MSTIRAFTFSLVICFSLVPIFSRSSFSGLTSDETQREQASSTNKDREAIMAVLHGLESAFSDFDLRRWLSNFHSSYLIMTPEIVVTPSSESEALSLVRPHIEALRARGYARSELKRATIKLLTSNTALAAVEWIRHKTNGEELERVGATYAFFKQGEDWKIAMLTMHPPDTLLELK